MKISPGPVPIFADNAQRQKKSFPRPIPIHGDESPGEDFPDVFDFGSPVLFESLHEASPLYPVLSSQGAPLLLRQIALNLATSETHTTEGA